MTLTADQIHGLFIYEGDRAFSSAIPQDEHGDLLWDHAVSSSDRFNLWYDPADPKVQVIIEALTRTDNPATLTYSDGYTDENAPDWIKKNLFHQHAYPPEPTTIASTGEVNEAYTHDSLNDYYGLQLRNTTGLPGAFAVGSRLDEKRVPITLQEETIGDVDLATTGSGIRITASAALNIRVFLTANKTVGEIPPNPVPSSGGAYDGVNVPLADTIGIYAKFRLMRTRANVDHQLAEQDVIEDGQVEFTRTLSVQPGDEYWVGVRALDGANATDSAKYCAGAKLIGNLTISSFESDSTAQIAFETSLRELTQSHAVVAPFSGARALIEYQPAHDWESTETLYFIMRVRNTPSGLHEIIKPALALRSVLHHYTAASIAAFDIDAADILFNTMHFRKNVPQIVAGIDDALEASAASEYFFRFTPLICANGERAWIMGYNNLPALKEVTILTVRGV